METVAAGAIIAAAAYFIGKRKKEQPRQQVAAPETKNRAGVIATLNTKVVGVTFDNENGTNRQDILSRVFEHDQIELEKYEYKGKPAVYVKCYGEIIGNLPADLAESMAARYPNTRYEGHIKNITGGGEKTIGCNIEIDIVET